MESSAHIGLDGAGSWARATTGARRSADNAAAHINRDTAIVVHARTVMSLSPIAV